MRFNKNVIIASSVIGTVLAFGSYRLLWKSSGPESRSGRSGANKRITAAGNELHHLQLNQVQLKSLTILPVGKRPFTSDREAIGVIDFNQHVTVQVSPPWTGRIVELFAEEGDDVKKGQVLFAIDSPDLVQAEATLISSAGVRKLAARALVRSKELSKIQGISQKDYEQKVSDQQAAEGAYQAARNAVRIFGKTDAEIDRIIAERRVDARLPVRSPIRGRVIARNAAPGSLVQPGSAPAPYAVSDLSSKWMLASVTETDLPFLRPGQAVDVRIGAYPGRLFQGRIHTVGVGLDPATHRATVVSEVRDPENELHPQMLATFIFHTGGAVTSMAVPETAVVREGDGTMRVWVSTDRQSFSARTVKTGLRQDQFVQILAGLKPGEFVVVTGGVFLSNMLASGEVPD